MLDDKIVLKKSIGLIVRGISEKESKILDLGSRYPHSPTLQHGINMFFACKCKHSKVPVEQILSKANETAFLTDYANKPVNNWFYDWDQKWLNNEKICAENYYFTDALIVFTTSGRFVMTAECSDLLNAQEKDLLNGIDQYELYLKLISLTQEQYILVRKFIIENPVVTLQKIRDFKIKLSEVFSINNIIEFAYEQIENDSFICKNCGWTMRKIKYTYSCCSPNCLDEIPSESYISKHKVNIGDYRLKKGIMKYTALPGKLELEIVKFCDKNNICTSLWPYMDRYDVQITFSDSSIWQIDAKAFKNPYHLCEKIKNDGGFPTGNYEKGFYAIPNDLVKDKRDYCKIVQDVLDEIFPRISCVSFTQLKKAIRNKKELINELNS